MEKTLSVIVPVYKVEDFVERCVESIVLQPVFSKGAIEVILVDDGSPDKSGDICDSLSQKYENVKVIHRENGGLSAARNSGISAATGEYLFFLDSDDSVFSNTLSSMLEMLSQKPDVLILRHRDREASTGHLSDSPFFFDGDRIASLKGEELLSYLTDGKLYNWYAWLNVVRREYILENDLFFCEGRCFEDVLWTPNVLFRSNKTLYLEKEVYSYLVNRSNSITRQTSQKNYDDKLYCIKHMEEFCKQNLFSKYAFDCVMTSLSQVYVSLLADNRLLKRNVRKHYMKEIAPYAYILRDATPSYKRLLYIVKPILRISGIAFVLYLRAQYVRRKAVNNGKQNKIG